ncbi:MAG TPA: hypothetical protein EYP10_08660 [Armatimonadetes bacterium]|nr:hypothetical protein [Armatimonadota bacterium]
MQRVAERIRETFTGESPETPELDWHYGLAFFPDDGVDAEDLVEVAQQRAREAAEAVKKKRRK